MTLISMHFSDFSRSVSSNGPKNPMPTFDRTVVNAAVFLKNHIPEFQNSRPVGYIQRNRQMVAAFHLNLFLQRLNTFRVHVESRHRRARARKQQCHFRAPFPAPCL